MKVLNAIAFLAILSSTQAGAAVTCPKGLKTTYSCVSTPVGSDQRVASELFEAITVCESGQKTALVFSVRGENQPIKAAKSVRAGGTTYSVREANYVFSISIPQAINPRARAAKSTFAVAMDGGPTGSSTYACKQNK